MRHRSWFAGVAAGALLVLSAPVHAQTCPNVDDQQELRKIPEIPAQGDGLNTTFDVQLRNLCVPTSTKVGTKVVDGRTINIFSAQSLALRTYVYKNPETGQEAFGYPGPTLRLRKANEDGRGGQYLAVLLKNSLAPEADDNACNNNCPSTQTCDCSQPAVDALIKKCTAARPPQECCCISQCTQKSPNCFHGNNTTNLHFHGSHSSPQPPQDYVLLDLKPNPKTGTPAAGHDEHGSHGVYGSVEYGQYQYRVDPFGWKQPEGTHWYHPHKHGSVGMQVANGMAGAMIIDGPFDDWLKKYYDTEKLMVIQQIAPEENFFTPTAAAPQILVNGQIQPIITVKPGEVQRWRFVNATMSSGALINITLPAGLQFRQIAMDGVRFSPANYECQPLINFNPRNPSFPCTPNPTGSPTLRFAPGNRADFLVQMPLTETAKGQGLRVERKLIDIQGDQRGGQRKMLLEREEALAPGAAEPALFTIVVDDGIAGNERTQRRKGIAGVSAKTFPTVAEWPPMPAYLRNITDDEVKGNAVKMTFRQTIAGTDRPWPYNQSPLSQFKIDSRQFDPNCVNVTTKMGTAAEWTVNNDTVLPHPFHIHTNPFQLVSVKGVTIRPQGKDKPEPVWMDTLSMPTATVNPSSPPVDPSTPISITTAPFVVRQRYEDFTGEYVLHCHFLGHEDRGMMFAVQTVCKDKPDSYGKAGVPIPECQGQFLPAVQACQ